MTLLRHLHPKEIKLFREREGHMELVSGVVKEDYSDYILYFIETLSDELKKEIRSRLVAVCYGVDQASSSSKIYSYKAIQLVNLLSNTMFPTNIEIFLLSGITLF